MREDVPLGGSSASMVKFVHTYEHFTHVQNARDGEGTHVIHADPENEFWGVERPNGVYTSWYGRPPALWNVDEADEHEHTLDRGEQDIDVS